jgi:hypothetical protein
MNFQGRTKPTGADSHPLGTTVDRKPVSRQCKRRKQVVLFFADQVVNRQDWAGKGDFIEEKLNPG